MSAAPASASRVLGQTLRRPALARLAYRPGVATVELALVLPLIVTMLLALWELGRMIEIEQTLANAAREGARQASTGQVSNGEVEARVLDYLRHAGLPTTHAVATVMNVSASGVDAREATQMDELQVTVSIPFEDVQWIAANLVADSSTLLTAKASWRSLKDRSYPTTVTSPAGS